MLQNLVLKVAHLHYSMVMEQIVILLVDPNQNPIFVPLLAVKLKILAPWAISHVPAHLISSPTWEKLVVLDHI
jgi:hypothetical protein